MSLGVYLQQRVLAGGGTVPWVMLVRAQGQFALSCCLSVTVVHRVVPPGSCSTLRCH